LEAPSWYDKVCRDNRDAVIAYFSAEFGLHECLPIYAGGLGILAGDHLKSASDLGIPLVGIIAPFSQPSYNYSHQKSHQAA
jgi:starch phosphorylase